jgi:cell wall-associated NlpC family hydrolase
MGGAVDWKGGNRLAGLPLAVTLALHLLLLAWLARPAAAPPDDAARRRSVLILVPLPRARVEPPPAAPAPRQPKAPVHPVAPAPPAPTLRPDTPVEPAAPAATAPERAAPYSLEAEDLLGSAKRHVGKIDRELRGGKPGVPHEADTPWGRFRSALAGAHIDLSHTSVQDSFTGPDGVTIYRIRQGDKVFCRATGSTAPPMVGRTEGAVLAGAGRFDTLGKASTAGPVPCPTGDRDWVRR